VNAGAFVVMAARLPYRASSRSTAASSMHDGRGPSFFWRSTLFDVDRRRRTAIASSTSWQTLVAGLANRRPMSSQMILSSDCGNPAHPCGALIFDHAPVHWISMRLTPRRRAPDVTLFEMNRHRFAPCQVRAPPETFRTCLIVTNIL